MGYRYNPITGTGHTYTYQVAERYEDCDGRFAFIAGYTDGGAPYGVMWEEVGIDPGLPFEEKVKLYHMQMLP